MLALGEDRIQELREGVHVQVSLFDALAHEQNTHDKEQTSELWCKQPCCNYADVFHALASSDRAQHSGVH